MAEVRPYGCWPSPLSAADVAASGTVAPAQPLRQVRCDGSDVYWLESRAAEGGRGVVVRWRDGKRTDMTPAGVDVGSRVHEYGGGDFAVKDGVVWYVDAADQALYRHERRRPVRLTPPGSDRYAAPVPTPAGDRLVCVRERHGEAGAVASELVELDARRAGEPRPLAGGLDFHADPAISPDGATLAWVSWSAGTMPWRESSLWLAPLGDGDGDGGGGAAEARPAVGAPGESIFQPAWSPDGALHFVSDRSGFWNLYRLADGTVERLTAVDADQGVPQWLLGLSTYAFLADGTLAVITSRDGFQRLELLDPATGAVAVPELPYTACVPASVASAGGRIAYVAASPRIPPSVVVLEPDANRAAIATPPPDAHLSDDDVAEPEPLRFASAGGEAHALFYPPASVAFAGPPGERPPLVVMAHGGPTNAAAPKLDPGVQFWTSRGFGFVDVNYRGSSGYGRSYRERLGGRWGIADVADCDAAARALVERGDADPGRLVIRGASAGGFTVCHALAGESAFAAGTSYFGVLDTEALARGMHRFEAGYLEWLVGPEPDALRRRSPLRNAERIERPLLFLQGLDDAVVPPAQVEAMVGKLRRLGRPFAAIAFPGEGHGFRRADTIERALAAEHGFYCRVLGLEPPEPPAPVDIENLDRRREG